MGMLNLDEMLDQDLANVEAAPNYITPENSVVRLSVKVAKAEEKKTTKPVAGQPDSYAVVVLQYEIKEVYEQEANTLPMAPGSIFSDQFQFSEKGLPYLKTRLAEIISAAGEDGPTTVNTTKMSALLAGVVELEFDARIKRVPQKDSVTKAVIPDQYNIRLENITAPRAQ